MSFAPLATGKRGTVLQHVPGTTHRFLMRAMSFSLSFSMIHSSLMGARGCFNRLGGVPLWHPCAPSRASRRQAGGHRQKRRRLPPSHFHQVESEHLMTQSRKASRLCRCCFASATSGLVRHHRAASIVILRRQEECNPVRIPVLDSSIPGPSPPTFQSDKSTSASSARVALDVARVSVDSQVHPK